MRWQRWSAAIVVALVVAVPGCSDDGDSASSPTLPAIVTTTPATTTIVVATTLPPYYEIQRGDTLTEIAAAFSIPVQALLDANPEIRNQDDIRFGQFIKIPPREGLVASALPATVAGQTVPTMPGAVTVAPTTSAP